MGSMDSMVSMQNLRSGIPGIPISGIMAAGFPHGFTAAVQAGGVAASVDSVKNGLNMLPMMLQSIPHPHGGAIPQHAMFSVGAMMAHAPPPSSSLPASSSSSLPTDKVTTTTTAASTPEAASPSSTTAAESVGSSGSDGGEKGRSQDAAEGRPGGAEGAAIITSTSRAHVGAAIGAGAGSHITFNPFLIPGMSHGLLYPHMFLPHGGIMALPAMPPGVVDGPQSSPKRRRKREREGEREKTASVEASESTVPASAASPLALSSSPSVPPASMTLAKEDKDVQEVGEDGPAGLQEPDSNHHVEDTAPQEDRSEDTRRAETAEEGHQDSEEQRQDGGEEA